MDANLAADLRWLMQHSFSWRNNHTFLSNATVKMLSEGIRIRDLMLRGEFEEDYK